MSCDRIDRDWAVHSNLAADTKDRIVISDSPQRVVLSNAIENRINARLTTIGVDSSKNEAHEISLVEIKQVLSASTELMKTHRYSVVVWLAHRFAHPRWVIQPKQIDIIHCRETKVKSLKKMVLSAGFNNTSEIQS